MKYPKNQAYLGFNDGDESVHLTNRGVAGKNVGVLQHGLVAGGVLANLENATPFSKIAAVLLVLGTTLRHVVKTLSGALTLRAHKRNNTLVNLVKYASFRSPCILKVAFLTAVARIEYF